MDDIELESIFAWRCEQCGLLWPAKKYAPNLAIVAEAQPVVELPGDVQWEIKAPFARRSMIICDPCMKEIEYR